MTPTQTPEFIIAETRAWVERAVIGLNLCPFAKAPQVKGLVRYAVSEARDAQALLGALLEELNGLAEAPQTRVETTLLIHPWVMNDFAAYNDFLEAAEAAVDELDLGGCLYYDPGATGSFSDQISCSDDLEYLMECEHAACDVSCSTSQNGYGACATEADDDASLCQSEYNAVYGTSSPCASVGSECFQGTTFQSALADVAKVMCE